MSPNNKGSIATGVLAKKIVNPGDGVWLATMRFPFWAANAAGVPIVEIVDYRINASVWCGCLGGEGPGGG